MSLAPSAPTASHLLHERDDDAAPRLERSASLEGSTSVNPKDYQWGQLTSSSQQQLFGQFMASSMQSLMLALQFPMHGGGFASWMLHAGGASNNAQRLPAAPAPPTFVGACCAPGPVAQGGPPAAPTAALLLSPAAAAPHSTAALETKKNAQLAATTCSNTKRKQGPPSTLPSSKISKIAKATAQAPTVPPAPPAAPPTTFYKVEQQQYAAEPLGLELDDICKLFDTTTTKEEHMGDCYTTGAGLGICPTSAPLCLDPPPYSFDQDFCLDGLLDIESVMAEMSSQCCDTTASASPEAFPPPPPPPAPAPARGSTRAAARPKARKAKAGSVAKAAACFPAPQLAPALQAAS